MSSRRRPGRLAAARVDGALVRAEREDSGWLFPQNTMSCRSACSQISSSRSVGCPRSSQSCAASRAISKWLGRSVGSSRSAFSELIGCMVCLSGFGRGCQAVESTGGSLGSIVGYVRFGVTGLKSGMG
jgi:hypothetical protein